VPTSTRVKLSQDPSNRPVLITGCSSGIGLSAATTLHERGFDVYATTRKAADTKQLTKLGIKSLQLDLDDQKSIERAVSEVLAQTHGKLYALFNNGGYGQGGAVEDLPTDALRAQFDTLVFGWHELTRQVIPVMRAQGHGRIIQNSSVLGFAAMPYRGAYNAAKFAIEGLTDTLRLELKDTNIHVSIIQPGPVRTRFRQNGLQKFEQHIDQSNSEHREVYGQTIKRLKAPGDASRFTVGPEAVVSKLVHALENDKPRSRYRVTKPTIAFAVAKRLLPVSVLDRLLVSIK